MLDLAETASLHGKLRGLSPGRNYKVKELFGN